MSEWSEYWRNMKNLRWSALDQHILEVVGNAMGWGPDRSLLELGGGRGLHSTKLDATCRCGDTTIMDPCIEARLLASRLGHATWAFLPNRRFDIVWSYGLVEHFPDLARQDLVDHHFRLAREQVVIVVPAATWTRGLSPPRAGTPQQWNYSRRQLLREMAHPGWTVSITSFAPLFGIRHIPDAFYPVVDKLVGWALPGNLLLGVARKKSL